MFRTSANKISLAASAILLCAGLAQAQTPPASPLSASWTGSPSPVGVTYDLSIPSAGSAVIVTITAGSATIFDIDPTTVPFWLSVSPMNGTTPNVAVSFVASSSAGSLSVGSYSGSVHAKVSGYADLAIPVGLTVTNGASTLSVVQAPGGTLPAINWVYGSGPLTQTLTVVSNNQPVAFTAVAANTTVTTKEQVPANWITLSAPSGIASSFGMPITVSFLSDVLNNAAVGATLTGTVTIHYASTNLVIAVTINVTEPFAKVTSIFPTQAPPSTTTALSVAVTGSGFGSAGFSTATSATIAYTGSAGGVAVSLTGIGGTLTVVNPTTIVLSIPAMDNQTVPVNVLKNGNALTLVLTNGQTGEPALAETATLTITTNPIINSITDAGALVEAAVGGTTNLAPYELISIFGNNFNSGAAVSATPDPTFSRYPSTLTVPASGGHAITVAVYNSTVSPKVLIANAYLIYVSNTQINALVPSGVAAKGITQLQVIVTYNSNASNAFVAKPVASNPGIFTTAVDGQGQGAILLPNFSVNTTSNLAVKGTTVMIYASGLGAPTSTAANTAGKSAAKAPGSCISAANYVTTEALASPATADGAVILASKIATNDLPPCFASNPTVTIGGKSATVSYAGWVADSVAGLYQINATVPTTAASGTAIPVVVTAGGVSSQAGVTMAIQ